MMGIVIAVLLTAVVVQLGILLAFLSNRVIPFMESTKPALGAVRGDHESGSADGGTKQKNLFTASIGSGTTLLALA
jgi:hypothetical protein